MAKSMRVDDSVRVQLLEALNDPLAVQPNIQFLKKKTGLHKATIKSSLDFLEKKGVLSGYGPKFDAKQFGYPLESFEILQVDLSEKKLLQQFLNEIQNDPGVYIVSNIVGSGTWNIMIRHIHKDIESYHKTMQQYFERVPGMYKLIQDRQTFHSIEPFYKKQSRTDAIIKIVKKEKGMD